MEATDQSSARMPPLFVVSGGAGALGKHVARIVLSQFPGSAPQVVVIPQVREVEQIEAAVAQVAARGGAIIHTLVDPQLREALILLARQHQVATVDTIGDPLAQVGALLQRVPLGQPGLYHGQHEVYLERIQAIEYTVEHDDGRNPHELGQADVVLTGVSRVGKTPLSIYLAVLGWKVANVPLVREIAPPEELFQIDRRRVIGLVIDVDTLMYHRRWRQQSFAGTAGRDYTDQEALYDEMEMSRRVFRRGGFAVVNVTNKPIEESADQVIALISRWFEHTIAR
jgi:regulator of PEP synthase PpsR (kinase-PPPase family)